MSRCRAGKAAKARTKDRLSTAAEINATGLYADYHALALCLAALYHAAPAGERADLARRALVAEGVALHFLEDSFSPGHYSATWGGAAWQKGSHDLYSTIGLTTMTWGATCSRATATPT